MASGEFEKAPRFSVERPRTRRHHVVDFEWGGNIRKAQRSLEMEAESRLGTFQGTWKGPKGAGTIVAVCIAAMLLVASRTYPKRTKVC